MQAGTARPVVVGYNGKAHSRRALAWAADEAARRGAPLLVVYAANYPGMTLEPGIGLLEQEPGALDAARETTARGVAEASASHPGVEVTGTTEVTSPTVALIEAGAEAALVVIGTRGYGRVAGVLLGSVGFAVAAGAECPVLVVKDEFADRPAGPEHRIVAGTDGSSAAVAAVRFAADRAVALGARLHLVTATGEHPDAVDDHRLRAAAEEIVTTAAADLRNTHPRLTVTTQVEDGPAERTLVDASADADLVVVGTRGRGAFRGMLLGSVGHAVIHGARCHVAVV